MNEVTFVFEPHLWNENGTYTLETESDAQKVADWFKDLNSWKEEETISFEPVTCGYIKCTFTTYEDGDLI